MLATIAAAMFGSEVRAQVGTLFETLPRAWEALQDRLGSDSPGETLLQRLAEGGTGILARLGASPSRFWERPPISCSSCSAASL